MSWLPPLMWEPGCCWVTIKTQVTHIFNLLIHKTGLDPGLLQVVTVCQWLGHVCSVKLEISPCVLHWPGLSSSRLSSTRQEQEEEGEQLFLVVSSGRRRRNGHKQKRVVLQLNVWKCFFTVRVVRHWNRFPREGMESPSVEILKTQLDRALYSLLKLTLLEQQRLGWMISRGPFQHRFCAFVILILYPPSFCHTAASQSSYLFHLL